jgi:hypothetical protein
MKKVLSMIFAAALMVACGTETKIVISGNLTGNDRFAADNKVELVISGTEETLATTTLDANKSFSAEIALPEDNFVLVVINDTPTMELITSGEDITFAYNAETQNVDITGAPNNNIMREFMNGMSAQMEALYSCESDEEAEKRFCDSVRHFRFDEVIDYYHRAEDHHEDVPVDRGEHFAERQDLTDHHEGCCR